MPDPAASLDLFDCPRHAGHLRLTPTACAALYRRGKRCDDRAESLHRCRGCPLGAYHAGEAAAPVPDRPPDPDPGRCLRCGARPRRLIRHQVCVSCYNRERELLTKSYRRNRPPSELDVQFVLVAFLDAPPLPALVASLDEAQAFARRQVPNLPVLTLVSDRTPTWRALCQMHTCQMSLLPGV